MRNCVVVGFGSVVLGCGCGVSPSLLRRDLLARSDWPFARREKQKPIELPETAVTLRVKLDALKMEAHRGLCAGAYQVPTVLITMSIAHSGCIDQS